MLKVSEIQMQTNEGRFSVSAAPGMTLGKNGAMTIALDDQEFTVPEESGLFSDWIAASDAKALILGLDRPSLLETIKVRTIETFNAVPVAQRTLEEREAVKALLLGLNATPDDESFLAMARTQVRRIFGKGSDPEFADARLNTTLHTHTRMTPEAAAREDAFSAVMRIMQHTLKGVIPETAAPLHDAPAVEPEPVAEDPILDGVPDIDFDEILGIGAPASNVAASVAPAPTKPSAPRFIKPAPAGSKTFLRDEPKFMVDPGYRKFQKADGSIVNMTELATSELLDLKRNKSGHKDDVVAVRKAMQAKEILGVRAKEERRIAKRAENTDQPTLPFGDAAAVAAVVAAAEIDTFDPADLGDEIIDFGDPDFSEDAPADEIVDAPEYPLGNADEVPPLSDPADVDADDEIPEFTSVPVDLTPEDDDIPDFDAETRSETKPAAGFPDEIDFEEPDWG